MRLSVSQRAMWLTNRLGWSQLSSGWVNAAIADSLAEQASPGRGLGSWCCRSAFALCPQTVCRAWAGGRVVVANPVRVHNAVEGRWLGCGRQCGHVACIGGRSGGWVGRADGRRFPRFPSAHGCKRTKDRSGYCFVMGDNDTTSRSITDNRQRRAGRLRQPRRQWRCCHCFVPQTAAEAVTPQTFIDG